MTDTYMTYALWGRGQLSQESAKALLEEYIPEDVGTIYRPDVVDRQHQGLRTALAWFEDPEFLGDGGAVPTVDIIASLVHDRDNNGDVVTLLALWPDEPTHEEFDFIESVQNSGITVLDLSRALDFLDLSLYSRPVPTKEEKAEVRAAASADKKPRGRPRKLSDVAKEETDGVTTFPTSGPLTTESKSVPEAELRETIRNGAGEVLLAAIDMYVEQKVVEILARYNLEQAAKAADAEDRPPFDGPYVDPNAKQYYKNLTTGNIRPATGKPRKGEVVVNLTDEEYNKAILFEYEPPF
jgi:hypothetical protein